jgi:hypothetical protein
MFGYKIRIGSTKAPDQTIEILVPILDNDSKFGEAELRVKNPPGKLRIPVPPDFESPLTSS